MRIIYHATLVPRLPFHRMKQQDRRRQIAATQQFMALFLMFCSDLAFVAGAMKC
jgi:hypothetical protein